MANIFNIINLKKTYYYLKRNGVWQTIGAALERVQAPYFADYTYVLPEDKVLETQRQKNWKNPVLFSVVVPAYETKEEFLKVLIDSLLEQTYPYFELIIADASSTDKVKAYCEKFEYGYKNAPKTDILIASLGNDAGIIGAAALVK